MRLTIQQGCLLAVISCTVVLLFTGLVSKSPTNFRRPRVINSPKNFSGFQEPGQLPALVNGSEPSNILPAASKHPGNNFSRSTEVTEPDEIEPSHILPTANTSQINNNNNNNCNASREPFLSIVPWQRVTYPGKLWKGLQLPVLVIGSSGRLGNLMGNYASLFGWGRAYNATVRIDRTLEKQLIKTFPGITLPSIDMNSTKVALHNLTYLGNYVYGDKEAAAAGLLGPHVFLAMGYPIEIQLFHAYSCEIRKEFTFAPDIREKVRKFWSSKAFTKDSTFVGFHIRRKDYLKYVKGRGETIPDKIYYKNAMNFYRKKFPKVVFLVGSDDTKYVKGVFKNYSDVSFVPSKSPEEDMAILASCNHSIITVGTFGFWTAYLAGGMVVYPGDFYIPNYPLQRDRYERASLDLFIPISRT